MSIADAINGVSVEGLTAGLVGRQVFCDGTVATVTSIEGEKALTDRAGMVDLDVARRGVLPQMGEVVLLHGQRVVWLEAVQPGPPLVAVVMAGPQVQHRSVTEVASIVATGEEPMDRQLCRALATMEAEHREQMRRLNADANEWADDNDLCSRYDEFMESQGMEGRTHYYTAKITITVEAEVEGRDFEAATQDWTTADILKMATEQEDSLEWELEDAS